MNPFFTPFPFATPPMPRPDAVALLNDPQGDFSKKEFAVASFAASYDGILPGGAVELLARKGSRWLACTESEILERKRDAELVPGGRPSRLGDRLDQLATLWTTQERALNGLPTFSAFRLVDRARRLGPVRNPLVARQLLHECLLQDPKSPLRLVASGNAADDFIEGVLVFLALSPLSWGRMHPRIDEVPAERDLHRIAHMRPPDATNSPYRSPRPPGGFDAAGPRTFCWLHLELPLPETWVTLPPHKVLNIDEERRAIEIRIAARGKEAYEIVWQPSHDDWESMISHSFWTGALKFTEHEFYVRFDRAYRRHETLRPLELALDAAMRTLQVVIAGRGDENPRSALARRFRDDMYDLMHHHGSGGGFLDDIGENPALLTDVRKMVSAWLSQIGFT